MYTAEYDLGIGDGRTRRGKESKSMFSFAERVIDVVHDSAQMTVCHVRRIAGVGATAVSGLVDEVRGLVWDCGDVVKTGLQPRPDEFDLRQDLGSIDLEPPSGRERSRHTDTPRSQPAR